jgi:hypothetical protein
MGALGRPSGSVLRYRYGTVPTAGQWTGPQPGRCASGTDTAPSGSHGSPTTAYRHVGVGNQPNR